MIVSININPTAKTKCPRAGPMENSPIYFPKEEKEKKTKFFNGERGRDKKVKMLRKKTKKEKIEMKNKIS